MKIFHLMSSLNYPILVNYIEFINNNFMMDQHTFLIIVKNNYICKDLKNCVNVTTIDYEDINKFIIIIDEIKKSDITLLHFLSFTTPQKLYILTHRSILNKLTWIGWGADLYEWRIKNVSRFRAIYIDIISLILRRKIKRFVGIFPPDIIFFKKEYRSKAMTFYASYSINMSGTQQNDEITSTYLDDKIKNNFCINIQVGHSSNPILNHIEVLKILSKYKNENMKIFLPLNYGSKEYGDVVEKEAKEIYGVKVNCIRNKMTQKEYIDFLKKIDIAIFNTNRQIGLGNVIPLLSMGKKIFFPKESVMYQFYNLNNVKIYDYSEIKTMTFESITKNTDINMKSVRDYINKNFLSKKNKIEMWKKVFNAKIQ